MMLLEINANFRNEFTRGTSQMRANLKYSPIPLWSPRGVKVLSVHAAFDVGWLLVAEQSCRSQWNGV